MQRLSRFRPASLPVQTAASSPLSLSGSRGSEVGLKLKIAWKFIRTLGRDDLRGKLALSNEKTEEEARWEETQD